MVPLSVLDLSPIVQGGDATAALRNTVDLARHAEEWGYRRYWLAEHHNMPGIASAATSIVIGHVAGATNTIRVGAGGIMLPNHSPRSPNSLEPSRPSIPAALIWVSAARRAPINAPCAPCAGTSQATKMHFPRMSWS
jgi:hypothetical protein